MDALWYICLDSASLFMRNGWLWASLGEILILGSDVDMQYIISTNGSWVYLVFGSYFA